MALTEVFLTGLTYLAYGQQNLAKDEFSKINSRAEFDFEESSTFCEKARVVQVRLGQVRLGEVR
jgi:hypothetical protein